MMPPQQIIDAAVAAAACSSCMKSKRGAAVYLQGAWGTKLIGTGFNSQPPPFTCGGQCVESCNRLAIHAEQRAIRAALCTVANAAHFASLADLRAELVHAKVVNGALVASGGPSCWQCSREILDVGIAGVWLYQEPAAVYTDDVASSIESTIPRWVRYPARDFHLATAIACGMKEQLR